MSSAERPTRTPARPRRRAVVVAVVEVLVVAASLEIGARIYWRITAGVPLLRPARVVHVFYPELAQLPAPAASDRDAVFDLAILGASVLHPNFGDVSARIGSTAATLGPRPVRVYNLAMPSQTSLDSRLKRLEMAGHRFDLVLVYHGINDVRANACPPEVFRDDYSHWSWYRYLASYRRHRENLRWLALPFTLSRLWHDLTLAVDPAGVVPHDRPPREWFGFAADVKTAGPYRRNLEEVVSRSGRVVLVTFASYVAPGYSEERFLAGELDYGRHTSPVELWGDPRWVAAGIEVHNRITREIALASPNARLVDLAAAMPRSGTFFDDVCHLTERGSAAFVEAVMPAVLDAMSAAPPPSPDLG